jgi:cytochrome c oxidase cbb3-type subunit 3
MALKPMLFSAVTFIIAATSLVSAQTMRGNPQAGQSVYQQHCLRCHGKQLDGNGPDRPTNLLSQASRAKTDWELLVTIANGALFTPMHDFRGKLTDEQMLDVMAYIRSVAPFDRVS